MRFIFLNRFYWPDEPATAQLLTDLAETLAARGHDVTVISSRFRSRPVPAQETQRGVTLFRIATPASKFLAFLAFSVGALIRLARIARPGDHVIALTDPPLIGIGAWIVARMKRARIFHWVQDIYPEIAVTVTGQTWLRVLCPARNLAWRRSDGCVAVGADLAETIRHAGVAETKIRIFTNWAPSGVKALPATAAQAWRERWNLTGKFIALYAGNLGRVHDLEPLLEVAERLRAHPHIALVFVGAGAQLSTLTAIVAERNLRNVHFHPPCPREQLPEMLAAGDVQLVTLRPGCEASVFPSKLYGAAAVGRPIVVLAPHDSELARLVDSRGFGKTFSRPETELLAEYLVTFSQRPEDCAQLGAAAAEFALANGGPERAARAWESLAATVSTA